MNKQTVRDLDAAGKKVLVRVDFNVPIEDGKVTDDSRVRAAIPTIALLLSRGAAVILASHLGRPNGRVVDTYRLRPVAERLSMLLGRYVPITGDALGVGTQDAVNRLKPGQVLMLENLRFHSEEEANDPKFAKTLAGYADVYVNDAFGTAHRAHASTVGITEYLPAYAGLLLEREVQVLSRLLESPERPFAAVLGGAKVSGKINVLDSLTERVDTFVVGGGMANTFLVAKGNTVGKSLLEKDRIDDARRVLEAAEKKGINFVLPVDVIVAKEVTRGAERKLVPAHKIPNSWSAVDVGPQTRELFEQTLDSARTVFWNGPLGVFEVPTFGDGTRAMARYLARRAEEGATVVVGGGDSVAAVEQLGLAPKMTHISTGGGASLEFLENGDLPGIAALLDREPAPAPAGTEPTAAPAATPASAAAPVGPAATTAKQQPGGPAQPAKPVPARVGVRALDATTPIATVSAPGDGAGTSRRPAPASAGRGNGRQPAAKPAGARDTTGRARTTGTGRAAGTTKAATSGRPATTGATAQRRKSAAPAAGAARRSTSAPRRAKAAAPASGRATGKKSATSSTRAGAKATGASKRSAARASAGAKPSTRRGASTGKAATKRTAGKKAAAKRATGAAKPATTRGKATAKPATKRAAAATKPAAKRGTAGSKTGMRSRASGGSSAAKGAKRTGGSAKGDTRRGSGSSGRNTRSTSAKRPSAAKPTQRRSSRTSQRRGTSR